MQRTVSTLSVVIPVTLGVLAVQPTLWTSTDVNALATVRITTAVLANGTPLPVGTYELRLTEERPAPLSGQPQDTQRWVEFVTGGKVVAREIAEVLRDNDLPEVGASSVAARAGTRVEMLKGGEFLRISVKPGHERYLIYLPVKR